MKKIFISLFLSIILLPFSFINVLGDDADEPEGFVIIEIDENLIPTSYSAVKTQDYSLWVNHSLSSLELIFENTIEKLTCPEISLKRVLDDSSFESVPILNINTNDFPSNRLLMTLKNGLLKKNTEYVLSIKPNTIDFTDGSSFNKEIQLRFTTHSLYNQFITPSYTLDETSDYSLSIFPDYSFMALTFNKEILPSEHNNIELYRNNVFYPIKTVENAFSDPNSLIIHYNENTFTTGDSYKIFIPKNSLIFWDNSSNIKSYTPKFNYKKEYLPLNSSEDNSILTTGIICCNDFYSASLNDKLKSISITFKDELSYVNKSKIIIESSNDSSKDFKISYEDNTIKLTYNKNLPSNENYSVLIPKSAISLRNSNSLEEDISFNFTTPDIPVKIENSFINFSKDCVTVEFNKDVYKSNFKNSIFTDADDNEINDFSIVINDEFKKSNYVSFKFEKTLPKGSYKLRIPEKSIRLKTGEIISEKIFIDFVVK